MLLAPRNIERWASEKERSLVTSFTPWFQTYGIPCTIQLTMSHHMSVESSWNVMAHGDTREGKWRGNWWMEWVVSTLHTTSEHGVSSITTADAHTSAASSRLNWYPRRFKWIRQFRRKTKSGFCACAITFQTQSTWCDGKQAGVQRWDSVGRRGMRGQKNFCALGEHRQRLLTPVHTGWYKD